MTLSHSVEITFILLKQQNKILDYSITGRYLMRKLQSYAEGIVLGGVHNVGAKLIKKNKFSSLLAGFGLLKVILCSYLVSSAQTDA